MPLAIKVKKEDAEKLRRRLVKKGLLDARWSIVEKDGFLYLPVKENLEGAIEVDLPKRREKKKPYEMIKNIVGDIEIPDFWEKIGDIIILPPFSNWEKHGEVVGKAFARVLRAKTVVINKGIYGELREPKIEIIYGDDTETVHVENGIRYKLDISKIMFSSGNVEERIRMAKINAEGEIVVDLFSGIGYFTLPLAIYGKAEKIYACEKNPVAFHYLLQNIRINDVPSTVVPLLGDNRNVAPRKIADRVIMGYIRTENFLDLGFKTLKRKGGILHYHDTFTTEQLPWKPEENLKIYGEKNGFQVEILFERKIKSYAPHIWHVVTDARAFPKD